MSLVWKEGGNNLVPKDTSKSVVFSPQEGWGKRWEPYAASLFIKWHNAATSWEHTELQPASVRAQLRLCSSNSELFLHGVQQTLGKSYQPQG